MKRSSRAACRKRPLVGEASHGRRSVIEEPRLAKMKYAIATKENGPPQARGPTCLHRAAELLIARYEASSPCGARRQARAAMQPDTAAVRHGVRLLIGDVARGEDPRDLRSVVPGSDDEIAVLAMSRIAAERARCLGVVPDRHEEAVGTPRRASFACSGCAGAHP